MVRGKTAALFSAATEAGRFWRARPRPRFRRCSPTAMPWELRSRSRIDLLDYGGSDAAIGKNTGDDFRERKVTLPVIKPWRKPMRKSGFLGRVIEKGKQAEGDLAQARAIMARHGAMEAARDDALAWSDKARAALRILPDHPLRDMLDDLADYVVARLT